MVRRPRRRVEPKHVGQEPSPCPVLGSTETRVLDLGLWIYPYWSFPFWGSCRSFPRDCFVNRHWLRSVLGSSTLVELPRESGARSSVVKDSTCNQSRLGETIADDERRPDQLVVCAVVLLPNYLLTHHHTVTLLVRPERSIERQQHHSLLLQSKPKESQARMVVVTMATLATGAATAATNTAATTVTTKLSLTGLGQVLDGKSNNEKQLRQKIKAAMKQRMLVPGDDFGPFVLDAYAPTPILSSMRIFPRTSGVIYVAYVPPSKGKSMACYAFLKNYAQAKAVAFSPPDNDLTYVDKILLQLNLDADAGKGLVNALVDELHDGESTSPSYLIFDDFMPNGPNHHDIQLLMQLKSRLRGKNVYCVVLTSNIASANYSLSRNKLASIQPLVNSPSFNEIVFGVNVADITDDFEIDWKKHCSMLWDDNLMKQTILLLPKYAEMRSEEKASVEHAIDDFLKSVPNGSRYDLTIYTVLSQIQRNSNIPPTPANKTATTPRPPDRDNGCCCFKSPLPARQHFFE